LVVNLKTQALGLELSPTLFARPRGIRIKLSAAAAHKFRCEKTAGSILARAQISMTGAMLLWLSDYLILPRVVAIAAASLISTALADNTKSHLSN
jgi:hypothetical protein